MAGLIGKDVHGNTVVVNLVQVSAAEFAEPKGGRKHPQLELVLTGGHKVVFYGTEAQVNWDMVKKHFEVRDGI